ncbi:MAG: DUF4326 domain-containing protein [Candidatus Nitrosotenuis sp.]
MCKVLNTHRGQISANTVYIDRPSKWGNPFIIGRDGNKEDVMKRSTAIGSLVNMI